MAESWITDELLQAAIDRDRSVEIPPGEIVQVGYYVGDGTVRIFWGKVTEGLGGLIVRETDLESCAHPLVVQRT